ncbi:26S proteasome non-ATPase regulatory subunit, partial [Trifolium medium]|nr:26S proteasome non-ATPase regulatory subunit [Trifolium medium]
NEDVAAAAINAIKKLASFPEGMDIVFPSTKGGDTDLGIIASQCSSLV